jgi:hypothetical protein
VGTCGLQALRILTLEPKRLKNRSTTPEKDSGDGKEFLPETLKRLAISVFQRRSSLLSSTASESRQQSCAPASAAPWWA